MQNKLIKYSGLATKDALKKRKIFGLNKVAVKRKGILGDLLHWLISPITLMLLAAAFLSLYSGHKFDFYFILTLAALNFIVSAFQRRKADQAIEVLQEKLIVKTKTIRNGKWRFLATTLLVPDDIIMLEVGDIIPADAEILSSKNFSANEAALTGESLPKHKKEGDKILTGSYATTGSAICRVKLTGAKTNYGQTLLSIEKSSKRSLLEREILTITYLLSALSILAIVFITITLITEHLQLAEILRLDLSLLIAGVPVSLPTVMAIIIGLGILDLARKRIIVRRLAALENLSNVNLLLTDKTGTLTQNQISLTKVFAFNDFSEEDTIGFARATVKDILTKDPISQAIINKSYRYKNLPEYVLLEHISADSERKRATAKIKVDSKNYIISCGAPQVIARICKLNKEQKNDFNQKVNDAAREGFRILAVAIGENITEEKNLRLVGILYLSDIPVNNAASIISHLKRQGINTKMITGDNLAISQRIGNLLGFKSKITDRANLLKTNFAKIDKSWWNKQSGFAEILPQDKYNLTEAAKKNFVVAVTGDGINDLPAVAAADVGIAVKNAVDALKKTADIVILTEGLAAIKDALFEARKIFERLYSYSVYRISESYRLIITIAFLGFIVHSYPLAPLQLILLAFLNDLPIITLAYNRVKIGDVPSHSRSKKRLYRGILHGTVGVFSSLGLYFILANGFHLSLESIQTAYFLKLTVSGHMLIYVAQTDERWYKFLPSRAVILATTLTQAFASLIAGLGLFMAPISLGLIGLVWFWSFAWMQVSDIAKALIPQK